jgi:hypothetical protein
MTTVCYFNKNVAEANKEIVGDLYQTVRDGKWTYDYCFDMAKQFSRDNGDGVWDTKDSYGAIQNTISNTNVYFTAAGIITCQMKDDGPEFNIMSKKMNDVIAKVREFYSQNNTSFVDSFNFSYESVGVPIFFDDRALLYFDSLLHASDFRDEESDFGIIPYPKYNEEQKNYLTYSSQWSLSCTLPVTATNVERTCSILEELSAQSRKLIVPAYYDKTLMGKLKRDEESEEMLNMIFEHLVFDFGMSYGLGCIPDALLTSTDGLGSWWKRTEKKVWNNAWELYAHVYKSTNGTEPPIPERAPV